MSAGGNEVVVKKLNLPEEQTNAGALLQLTFCFLRVHQIISGRMVLRKVVAIICFGN